MTAIESHLIQSTLFATVAALLTLVFQQNRAQIRYALWLTASIKFLIPFSLLIAAGKYFGVRSTNAIAAPILSSMHQQLAEPLTISAPLPESTNWLPAAFALIWIIGFAFIVSSWYRRWHDLRAAVRTASPIPMPVDVQAFTSPTFPEPGVYGIFKPILLLPAGITDQLTPAQLKSILDHELCHIRRHDNLATAIHMTVEAIFWFHPLVWWLGARLMEERERACDEEVLRQGNAPETYAEAILKICELYLESPLPCISGITGANLRQRIEAIVRNRTALPLSRIGATLITVSAIVSLAVPIAIGILNAPMLIAESPAPANIPKFNSASIIPCGKYDRMRTEFLTSAPGTLESGCVTPYTFIKTAYARTANPFISGGPIWISMDFYRINATAIGNPTVEMMRGRMLQALLESRFRLKVHREIKESAMYALTVASDGPKLHAVPDGNCAPLRSLRTMFQTSPPPPPPVTPTSNCGAFSGNTPPGTPDELKASQLIANGADLDTISEHLASLVGRPVINRTGLQGAFTFRITFAKADTLSGPLAAESVFTVLQNQLGLKLEPTTGPREFIYIDRAERP